MRDFRPKRILVPTDFTAVADNAFGMAREMAERFGSEIIVANCNIVPSVDVGYPTSLYLAHYDAKQEEVGKKLEQYADQRLAGSNVPYIVSVIHDGPIHGITRRAERLAADLIVMGTHGRSGFDRVVHGSIAEGILRSTSIPVVTVHTPVTEGITRIVCPVNHSAVGRQALEYAASLALTFDAELFVATVLEPDHRMLVDEQPPLRQWIPQEVRSLCRYTEFVERGNPAEKIIGFAQRCHASLIVLGAQHKRFLDESVIGITSERVMRHSPIPVLTVVAPIRDEEAKSDESTASRKRSFAAPQSGFTQDDTDAKV